MAARQRPRHHLSRAPFNASSPPNPAPAGFVLGGVFLRPAGDGGRQTSWGAGARLVAFTTLHRTRHMKVSGLLPLLKEKGLQRWMALQSGQHRLKVDTAAMSQPKPDFLDLSVAERIHLAADIWDSIAAGNPEAATLTPTQLQELQVRLDAHEQDPSSAVPWEQVRSELFASNR